MVSPLCLAFSPAVRPGSLLHYLKITLPVSASKPLQVLFSLRAENKTVNLCLPTRRGEKVNAPQNWKHGPPMEKVVSRGLTRLHRCSWLCWTDSSSLVSSTYSARWCSSVNGGNRGVLFTMLCCNFPELCGMYPEPLHTKIPGWVAEIWWIFQKEPVKFNAQSKGRNNMDLSLIALQ